MASARVFSAGETEALRARLLSSLSYDEDTGVFCWRAGHNVFSSRRPGFVAGTVLDTGYRAIRIDGVPYYAHRLAWLYVTGEWPPAEIDHRNRQRDDNRLSNLRLATRGQNAANVGRRGLHGLPRGVSRLSRSGKFQASISVGGRNKYLGRFDTAEEAGRAFQISAAQIRGDFNPILIGGSP